jgi:predicted amidophosphoribosyltransferase
MLEGSYMNIIQCQFCKKPFASVGGRICPACNEQMDRDFITVRDYIYDHKESNIDEIAKETEVKKQVIIHLLKEGRLIIDSPDGEGAGILICEMCKKPINTGRLCKDCIGKVSSVMDKNVSANKKPEVKADERNFKGSAKINK